jgi:hypothetical protein
MREVVPTTHQGFTRLRFTFIVMLSGRVRSRVDGEGVDLEGGNDTSPLGRETKFSVRP